MNLKCVMIGAGCVAQFQAEDWKRIEGVTIVAVADPAQGRAPTHGLSPKPVIP